MKTHRYVGFIINDCSALRCQRVLPCLYCCFKCIQRRSEYNKIRELCGLFWQVLAGNNCLFIGLLWGRAYSKVIHLKKFFESYLFATSIQCCYTSPVKNIVFLAIFICNCRMELIHSNTILKCTTFRVLVLSLRISILSAALSFHSTSFWRQIL